MRLYQKAEDSPGAAQPLLQHLQFRIGLPFSAELPDRKAEATFSAVQSQKLPVLPLGIDRHPGRAQKLSEGLGAQHIFARQDVRSSDPAPVSGSRKSVFKLGAGFLGFLDNKGRALW